ncbi:MAG: hypothetical protein NXI22_07040 [bacterium]|nr:hypothetical protein [bacterium]
MARLVVGMSAVLIVSLIAYYVISRLRGQISDDPPTSHDLLANFEEKYSKGDISLAEYRKVKTQLSNQLKDELNPTSDED